MIRQKEIATLLFLLTIFSIFAEDVLFLKSTSYCEELTPSAPKIAEPTYKTAKSQSDQAILSTSYKRYLLFRYGELYILCEPYVVQHGDWVYKIFRTKGELSKEDFGLFMRIFKSINPKIKNTNKIAVGQNITIPLKKSKKSDFKEISPGVVELPIITLSQIPDTPKVVKKSLSDKKTLSSATTVEPTEIKESETQPEQNIVKKSEPLKIEESITANIGEPKKTEEHSQLIQPVINKTIKKTASTPETPPVHNLKKFAALNNGELILKGKYYFPRNNGDDLVVDVSLNPVMQSKNGAKILFVPRRDKFEEFVDTIKKFWQNFTIMEFNDVSSLLDEQQAFKKVNSQILSKENLEEAYVPINLVVDQEHKSAVKQLLAITNYKYTPEKEITIQVGSITVKATLGLITRNNGNILIAFGDIYGSAFESLRKKENGNIITISPLLGTMDVVRRLFSVLGASTTDNPSFVNPDNGKVISIEGIYINADNHELFITKKPALLRDVFRYLTEKNITILKIDG